MYQSMSCNVLKWYRTVPYQPIIVRSYLQWQNKYNKCEWNDSDSEDNRMNISLIHPNPPDNL